MCWIDSLKKKKKRVNLFLGIKLITKEHFPFVYKVEVFLILTHRVILI
jgi:hypothetical protein